VKKVRKGRELVATTATTEKRGAGRRVSENYRIVNI